MKKSFSLSILAATMLFLTSSCGGTTEVAEDVWITYDFTLTSDNYNKDGYWVDVYNTEVGPFGIEPTGIFSHKAESTTYDGVKYESFTGFCPSIVTDSLDHTGSDWTQYQFASIANPMGFGYFIAHWDVRENESTPLEDRSCLINFMTTVKPVAMTLTNTTYAYWVMKNGSAFSKPFGPDDYLVLDIYGVKEGKSFLGQSVYLAQKGEFVKNWQVVNLTSLGDVQQIYFTMRSSDSGEWGMNTPAYFAIGSIQVVYPGGQI